MVYSQNIPNKGLDIFQLKKTNGSWDAPISWSELNSGSDDIGVEMIDSLNGYFSSNRVDGIDKIYYFQIKDN